MSIKARFYTFTKTVDSTERPSGSGTEFDIVLKEAVSVSAPVIELQSNAFQYNYCYIPAFGRYYFVQQAVILNNARLEYHLSVDVLATYKTEILNSELYVLRSASSYNNKLIDDTWTHTSDFTESVSTSSFPGYDAEGCYIMTVVNSESGITANPASCMYVVSRTQLLHFMGELFDMANSAYQGLDDLTATYFNPAQYITSCRWIPFGFQAIKGDQGYPTDIPIKYGWYTATATAVRCSAYGKTITFSKTIGSYNDWTDRDPGWTRYALYVPGFGITEIDPIYSGQTLSGKISIDFNTCQASMMLTTGTGQIAAQMSGKIGADVAINQVGGSIDIPDSIGGLVSKGIQIAGGTWAQTGFPTAKETFANLKEVWTNPINSAEGNAAREALISSGKDIAKAAAESAKQAIFNPTVTTTGADGCRYTITDNHTIYLYRRKYNHYNPAVSKLGGVCNQVKLLSTLSGYTQVANGLIDMAGTVEERNAIAALLEGGFFIA